MSLHEFEACCLRMYTSTDANERKTAEASLLQLSAGPSCIPQCQFVLDNSTAPCAATSHDWRDD